MPFAISSRLGTFGLLAVFAAQTAFAGGLDRLFRPVVFEELVAPANEPSDTELPAPPEPVPPAASEESILQPPAFSDELPMSPYDAVPYEVERSTHWPTPAFPSHQHDHDAHSGYDAYRGLTWDLRGVPEQRTCCKEPRIKYWNHPLLATETCSCHNTAETTVLLTVPTDCCSVEVPVCVTACCESIPQYECSRDLLGRKTHVFCWPCGQRVKIVDRHTGTLVVHTYRRDS